MSEESTSEAQSILLLQGNHFTKPFGVLADFCQCLTRASTKYKERVKSHSMGNAAPEASDHHILFVVPLLAKVLR